MSYISICTSFYTFIFTSVGKMSTNSTSSLLLKPRSVRPGTCRIRGACAATFFIFIIIIYFFFKRHVEDKGSVCCNLDIDIGIGRRGVVNTWIHGYVDML